MRILNYLSTTVIAVGVFSLSVQSQHFGQQYSKRLGNLNNGTINSIISTNDSGFAMAGSAPGSNGKMDLYLLKTGKDGVTQWLKTFSRNRDETGIALQQTLDGGYIVAGATTSLSSDSSSDGLLVKFNSTGNIEWNKNIGKYLLPDDAVAIRQTPADSGFIVVGSVTWNDTNTDIFLQKTDQMGNILWSKTFGYNYKDEASSIELAADGYVIAGECRRSGHSDQDAFYLKVDFSGKILWDRYYGGNEDERINGICQGSDGGLVLAGTTYSYGNGDADEFVMKIGSTGSVVWTRLFGGACVDMAYAVTRDPRGGYFMVGASRTYGPKYSDCFIRHINESGLNTWFTSANGAFSEKGSPVCTAIDSGFAIAHYKYGDGAPVAYISRYIPVNGSSTPTTHILYWEPFTCVSSLENIGYKRNDIAPTFWEWDVTQEAMMTTSPGGADSVSLIYSPQFNGLRSDSILVIDWKTLYPTTGGPAWKKNNRTWVSLCDAVGTPLYTLLFMPVTTTFDNLQWEMFLFKDYNGLSSENPKKMGTILAQTTTNLFTPVGSNNQLVTFRIALYPNGKITVFFDAVQNGIRVPVMSAIENSYSQVNQIQFKYMTGTKRANNHHIFVDNVNAFLVPTNFPGVN
jgi:hypothetical protein